MGVIQLFFQRAFRREGVRRAIVLLLALYVAAYVFTDERQIAGIGMALNLIAMTGNGYLMPARISRVWGIYRPLQGARFRYLGDWIPVGIGFASIGDLLIVAGLLVAWL